MFYVRLKFLRDASGRVTAMVLLYDTGQRQECPRTDLSSLISLPVSLVLAPPI